MPFLVTRLRARAVVLAATLLLTGLLAGCGALADDGPGDGRRVVAAFYPLQYVAQRVAGEHLEVTNLTSAGGEPHDLELTVQETAEVAAADLVVFQSGFQPAVDAAVDQNATGEVLDVADTVELRPAADHSEEGHAADGAEEGHGDEGAEEGHGHGELDPHFWLDPLLMAELGDAVADRMAGIDEEHADDFAANADRLRADLERLDTAYAEGLASCERDTVVVNHDAFGYLAKYDLHLEPIVGISPDAEPTPADLSRLRELIRTESITTVFAETLVSRRTAETLAGDLGLEVAVLDPVEGLSDESDGEDYLSLMRANLDELREANGC